MPDAFANRYVTEYNNNNNRRVNSCRGHLIQ